MLFIKIYNKMKALRCTKCASLKRIDKFGTLCYGDSTKGNYVEVINVLYCFLFAY